MTVATAPTYLRYKLRLRSPAIVSTLAGGSDSAATQPFVPGSAIRGAVAARLLAEKVAGDSEEFRLLVLSGAVRYLHAYPEIGGIRALPMPASWRSDKDGKSDRDLAAYSGKIREDDDADDFGDAWPEDSFGMVGKPFTSAAVSGGKRKVDAPRIDARLHQQRDRVKGRSWKDKDEIPHGTLFACEYLEADQVFHGLIQMTPAAAEQIARVETLLSRSILIGRSRRAGYGGEAEIELRGRGQREYDDVAGGLAKDIAPGERFRLMLVSAYIGRHPEIGQVDPTALEREVRDRLDGHATIERRRWSFETLGGFNRKWRLEVPQAHAVAAGAILVLEANKPISLNVLRRIEHEGLGERRVEGFGRVLFLEHSDDEREIRISHEKENPNRLPTISNRSSQGHEDGTKQLAFIEKRIVLAAAQAEIDRVAADIARKVEVIPSTSLLGRIRTLFRGVYTEDTAQEALKGLASWCEEDGPHALAQRARASLDHCVVRDRSLRQWLRNLAVPERGKSHWNAIAEASGSEPSITGLAQKHYLTGEDAAKAVLEGNAGQLAVRLIDGVLAALARKNRGGSR